MINLAAVVSFLAVSVVVPSAHAIPSLGDSRHHHRDVAAQFQERGYAKDDNLLEPYENYHRRYQLFHCESRHDTAFWNQCCHPLLKDEPEDALPDICFQDVPCDPSTTTTTSSTPKPPHTQTRPHYTTTTTPLDTPTTPPHTSHTTTTHDHPNPQTTTSAGGGGGGGGGSGWYTNAFGTYYYQNRNAGACGDKHSEDDLIVAINIHFYGDTGKKSPYCGKTVEIVNLNNGNTVKAIVADVCPTCVTENSMDCSVGTFKALEPDLSVGQIPIKWRIV